jgi:TetR/AcrR family transcriptional regulator
MGQGRHLQSNSFASRHERAAETRAAILGAAEDLFARAGLDGARTEAIASAAGVNKALLYYYFKSKEDIYLAVLDSHRKAFLDRGLEILSRKRPAREVLLEFVSAHFDFISSHRHYPGLFQRSMMGGGPRVARIMGERIRPMAYKMAALLRRGMREGEFRSFDVRHTAVSLVGLTVFYFNAAPIIQVVSGEDPFGEENVQKRKREVLRFIRYALFKTPEEVAR